MGLFYVWGISAVDVLTLQGCKDTHEAVTMNSAEISMCFPSHMQWLSFLPRASEPECVLYCCCGSIL